MIKQDLSGQVFGRLRVIERSNRIHPTKGRSYWECECSCGNKRTIQGWSLTSGNTQSCGCLQREIVTTQSNRKDLVGKKFHKLCVLEYSRTTEHKKAVWKCRCDCGNIVEVIGGDLISGRTRTCECRGMAIGESMFNSTYSQYQANARKRSLDFELSKEEFRNLTKQHCFYCGIPPSNHRKGTGKYAIYNLAYNGIDRINNSQGYTIENSVPCCDMCNKAKNKHSKDDFLTWISSVFIHSIQMNKAV